VLKTQQKVTNINI